MARRVHVRELAAGRIEMDQRNAHYLRDVLRLKIGTELELFDDAGAIAAARIVEIDRERLVVDIDVPRTMQSGGWQWSIASAVPKGNRADWMVEKLSEFGASTWIPLITARSVVHPEGNKPERWQRIAEESSRQCGRNGVMRIEMLSPVEEVLKQCAAPAAGFCLHPGGEPITQALSDLSSNRHAIFLIGPEGGWTDEELHQMNQAAIGKFALATNILRIETAAIAVGAIAQMKKR